MSITNNFEDIIHSSHRFIYNIIRLIKMKTPAEPKGKWGSFNQDLLTWLQIELLQTIEYTILVN